MSNTPKHGSYISLEELENLNNRIANEITTSSAFENLKPIVKNAINLNAYNYFFPDLVADPQNRLDSTVEVIKGLKDLGTAMKDTETASDDSGIPAAFTYFGQFIDHDITLEAASDIIANVNFELPFFDPIPPADLKDKLKNTRSGSFDLDSLYTNAPKDNGKLRIGNVSLVPVGQRPPNKIDGNDLPRKDDPKRTAEIGDPRNDENTIIAQLHVAFLKFHNAVMAKQGVDFLTAEKIVRQHYQWIVIHDFLKRICDPAIVNEILTNGNKIYNPTDENFFMPVEFSAAAYRFGHSMVRTNYNFNLFFNLNPEPPTLVPASLDLLFRFTGLSGDMNGEPTLPQNWIIEWENLLPFQTGKHSKARKIDTKLTVALQRLPGGVGVFQFLAKRNLLRGYLLSLPTGQALARRLLNEAEVLTPEQVLNNASAEERAALESAGLHIKTPLWYYVLAEAAIQTNGQHLGKLGSIIVAATIIGLIRRSENSILQEKNWQPTLGTDFNLEQLLLFTNLGPGQQEQ